jgi:hypothetical protein
LKVDQSGHHDCNATLARTLLAGLIAARGELVPHGKVLKRSSGFHPTQTSTNTETHLREIAYGGIAPEDNSARDLRSIATRSHLADLRTCHSVSSVAEANGIAAANASDGFPSDAADAAIHRSVDLMEAIQQFCEIFHRQPQNKYLHSVKLQDKTVVRLLHSR